MRLASLALAAAAVLSSVSVATAAPLCFPKGFLLGSATASYQVEGAYNEGGRTSSIWDDYCRQKPALACADVADDFYHRYVSDIAMMKAAGHQSFRFSVSWSRAMNWDPATKRMKPNAQGLAFYHALVDELIRNEITPILTIYHWDLPSELETQLPSPGWLSAEIQDHFVEFSELLFREFGRKVHYWTTFNEPLSFALLGYGGGLFGLAHAPDLGPSDTYQYTVAHNVLLSHAKAVHKFREMKTTKQVDAAARIGIVLVSEESVPMDPADPADVAAAERTRQFMVGWWLEPIVSGDYPKVMRERAGDRLPTFTPEQSALLKGSYDLFMVNHYTTHLVTDCSSPKSKAPCASKTPGWTRDLGVDNDGKPVGARPSSLDKNGKEICGYFSSVPEGYRSIIRWTHEHDKTADILLTENGYCGNDEIDNQDQLWYHQKYLEQVHLAITEDKIPVIGYTAWSLMDNYEWGSFKPRFGLYYVNYTDKVGSKDAWTPKPTDLQRIPRTAAKWFAKVAQTGCMEPWTEGEKVDEIAPVSTVSSAEAHGLSTYWIVVIVVAVVAVIAAAVVGVRRRQAGNARERSPLLH